MGRSDSSPLCDFSVTLCRSSFPGCRAGSGAQVESGEFDSEVSLGHAHHHSQHPSVNHVTACCVGLRLPRQARPTVPPNHVHLCSRLLFGYDHVGCNYASHDLGPFTNHLTGNGCLCLRRHEHTQLPPTGFEPAGDVRCKAHLGGLRPTGQGIDGNWWVVLFQDVSRDIISATPPLCFVKEAVCPFRTFAVKSTTSIPAC